MSDPDPAAIRRFNHKIEFGCLKPEGAATLYKMILAPFVGSDLEKKVEHELKEMKSLTPGDFKVVFSKFSFKDREKISHEALIESLKEEGRIKQVHSGQKAGVIDPVHQIVINYEVSVGPGVGMFHHFSAFTENVCQSPGRHLKDGNDAPFGMTAVGSVPWFYPVRPQRTKTGLFNYDGRQEI
jgi:hypothetical protein